MNNNTASNTSRPRPKMLGGITGKGWMPGQSGNPRGTPKGTREGRRIMREIKRLTHDGRDLVARLVGIANGQMVRLGGLDGQPTPVLVPSIRDQREALVWLFERYGGKPKVEIEAVGLDERPPFLIVLRHRPGSVDPLAAPPPREEDEGEPTSPTLLALPPAVPPPRRNEPSVTPRRGIGQVWDGGEEPPTPER